MPVLTKRSGKRTHAAPAPTPIKPIREWFGLSQEACARALGVGRATIARWEARRTGPDPNTAEGRLLAALTEARDLAIKQFGPQQAHHPVLAFPLLEDVQRRPETDGLVHHGAAAQA